MFGYHAPSDRLRSRQQFCAALWHIQTVCLYFCFCILIWSYANDPFIVLISVLISQLFMHGKFCQNSEFLEHFQKCTWRFVGALFMCGLLWFQQDLLQVLYFISSHWLIDAGGLFRMHFHSEWKANRRKSPVNPFTFNICALVWSLSGHWSQDGVL